MTNLKKLAAVALVATVAVPNMASASTFTFEEINSLDGFDFRLVQTVGGMDITTGPLAPVMFTAGDNTPDASFTYTYGMDTLAYQFTVQDLLVSFEVTSSGSGTMGGGTAGFRLEFVNPDHVFLGGDLTVASLNRLAPSSSEPMINSNPAFAVQFANTVIDGGTGILDFDVTAAQRVHAPVPLPAPMALLISGLAGLGFLGARKSS